MVHQTIPPTAESAGTMPFDRVVRGAPNRRLRTIAAHPRQSVPSCGADSRPGPAHALQCGRTPRGYNGPMTTRWATATAAAAILVAAAVVAQDPAPAPGSGSIRAGDLEADVRFLAADSLRGRLTDTPENRIAADFIASRFARHGLAPVGADGTHFHRFDLLTTALGPDNDLRVTGAGQRDPVLGPAFYPDPVSATASTAGNVVFVGFGIDAPSLGHDDYRDAELAGAVALMLDHQPGEFRRNSPFDGTVRSESARLVRKVLAAQARGAVAVLVAPDLHNRGRTRGPARPMGSVWPSRPPRVPRYGLASWVEAVDIPVVHISGDLAERIAEAADRSFDELTEAAERPGGAAALPLAGPRVELTTSVRRTTVANRNVVGLIEGADPALRDEWIIIGAHYDHDGARGSVIYNGADDDASGVAALIEIAEAYRAAAHGGDRPGRSILLAAWNSEEQGLLGAWAYTEAPLHPLDRTVAVVNMDMIGRDEEIPRIGGIRFRGFEPQSAESNRNAVNVLGYSRSPDLRRAVERANRATDLDVRFRYDDSPSNLLRRSDQWPFLFREIPALFVHTGLHPDYHTERDTPEKLRYGKMTRIVRMVHQLSWDLAGDAERPAYVRP